jgi:hypothetical protein
MPLIDDQARGTDRRSTARWPWVLVVAGLALLWIMASVLVSYLPRAGRDKGAAANTAVRQVNTTNLQQAESMRSYGNWSQARSFVDAIDPQTLSLAEKHTYLRVGAESYCKSGDPAKGAEFYDRFLSMSPRIHARECQDCHAPSVGIFPKSLSDMQSSPLGRAYAQALGKAGKLRPTRDAMSTQLQKKPGDLRLHVLLYHLETALKNRKASAGHLHALKAFDAKH